MVKTYIATLFWKILYGESVRIEELPPSVRGQKRQA